MSLRVRAIISWITSSIRSKSLLLYSVGTNTRHAVRHRSIKEASLWLMSSACYSNLALGMCWKHISWSTFNLGILLRPTRPNSDQVPKMTDRWHLCLYGGFYWSWPVWLGHSWTKAELVVDQFLMDSHELNVQVAAHDHRSVEDGMWVACSLEAFHEEEKRYSRGWKPTPQACFVTNERDHLPDTERLPKEVLAQLGCDLVRNGKHAIDLKHPGIQQVRSAEWKDTKLASWIPSRDCKRERSPANKRQPWFREGPAQC